MKPKLIYFEDHQWDFLQNLPNASEFVRTCVQAQMNIPKTEEQLLKRKAQLEAKIQYEKKLKEIDNGFIY